MKGLRKNWILWNHWQCLREWHRFLRLPCCCWGNIVWPHCDEGGLLLFTNVHAECLFHGVAAVSVVSGNSFVQTCVWVVLVAGDLHGLALIFFLFIPTNSICLLNNRLVCQTNIFHTSLCPLAHEYKNLRMTYFVYWFLLHQAKNSSDSKKGAAPAYDNYHIIWKSMQRARRENTGLLSV